MMACIARRPESGQIELRAGGSSAGTPAVRRNPRVGEIVVAVSAERIEGDIRRLAAFGTRHTLSDTLSATRGIGAARRWFPGR